MSEMKQRTKTVVSLGPNSYSEEVIRQLMLEGTYMFRNNFSHMLHEDYRRLHAMVMRLNQELGLNVLMLGDLQGPHIRIGTIADEGIKLEAGQIYWFYCNGGEPQENDIPINDDTLHQFVKVGEPMCFLNGDIEGVVEQVEGYRIAVKIKNSGTLKSKKAINVPETFLPSCLTEKDKEDLKLLLEVGVDWVAISFVSRKEEIEELRALINNPAVKIMSKVERRTAVDNIVEIVQAGDSVMVARGDLGIEVPMEDVPFIQKDIIALSHQAKKPVLVATQLLLSMVTAMRPTRAEVSDVANAVLERADGLFLSDETTIGIDPVNALRTMNTIARRAEEYLYGEQNYYQ